MCEFENTETSLSRHDIIKQKLREHFDGKIVRKDLTKKMKDCLLYTSDAADE